MIRNAKNGEMENNAYFTIRIWKKKQVPHKSCLFRSNCDRFKSYSLISPKHARLHTAKSEQMPFNLTKLNIALKMIYCPNG